MSNMERSQSILEMHFLSIPSIDRIVSSIIKVNKKVLLLFLKLARVYTAISRMYSCDAFHIFNSSKFSYKYKQDKSGGLLVLLI